MIPFFDLKQQYRTLQPALDQAVLQCLQEASFVRGQAVGQFEEAFAHTLGVRHAIATGNGTDSLFAALKCLGTLPGDEIITPAFSWISTAETISLCQARPVFVDIHPTDYTIDPEQITNSITPRTRGIIITHLYGQAAQAQRIKEICTRHGLFLIEDCAQAHLTAEHHVYAGTIGHAGTFSFYPTKNLGAYGDAGCVVTNDDALATALRRFCNHGALQKDDHVIEGINSRMDTIQAAVLAVKLPHLQTWNAQRAANAHHYQQALQEVSEIVLPTARPDTAHTYHIYAIRSQKRDQLKEYLAQRGIQTTIHYPAALPNLPAYQHLHHRPEDFAVASAWQAETLSLPIYPELTLDQILYVSKNIHDFYAHQGI